MGDIFGQDNKAAVVDANTRFLAAQGEINSRVESKIQIQIYHLISILALLAAFVTAMTISADPIVREFIFSIISLFMPLASSYFVTLYVHNDRIIGSLGAFAESLEIRSKADMARETLVGWYSETGARDALVSRKRSNRATNYLTLASPCMIIVSFILSCMEKKSFLGAVYSLQWHRVASFLISILVIYWLFRFLQNADKFRDSAASRHTPRSAQGRVD